MTDKEFQSFSIYHRKEEKLLDLRLQLSSCQKSPYPVRSGEDAVSLSSNSSTSLESGLNMMIDSQNQTSDDSGGSEDDDQESVVSHAAATRVVSSVGTRHFVVTPLNSKGEEENGITEENPVSSSTDATATATATATLSREENAVRSSTDAATATLSSDEDEKSKRKNEGNNQVTYACSNADFISNSGVTLVLDSLDLHNTERVSDAAVQKNQIILDKHTITVNLSSDIESDDKDSRKISFVTAAPMPDYLESEVDSADDEEEEDWTENAIAELVQKQMNEALHESYLDEDDGDIFYDSYNDLSSVFGQYTEAEAAADNSSCSESTVVAPALSDVTRIGF
jgi:hypothetical protein